MKVIIYGLGRSGKMLLEELDNYQRHIGKTVCDIVALVDSNSDTFDSINMKLREKCRTIDCIANLEYDYVVITTLLYFESCRDMLLACGVDENKIISSGSFLGEVVKDIRYWNQQNNIFNEKEEVFIIDTDNVDEISDSLYGYIVCEKGIFTRSNVERCKDIMIQKNGCYAWIRTDADEIRILRDAYGNYGMYLYEEKDYFAISNSFWKLAEYLSKKRRLTLNERYRDYFSIEKCSSQIVEQTLINEIRVLGRTDEIRIDRRLKTIAYGNEENADCSVDLDSQQGMELLDAWFSRWTSIFHNLYKTGEPIITDLSGGMDSRIVLLLALHANIDLNAICVNSWNSNLHTFSEDYKIASDIAKYFGFELNKNQSQMRRKAYTVSDLMNMAVCSKWGIHKQLFYPPVKYEKHIYQFSGVSGEGVRYFSNATESELVNGIKTAASCFDNDTKEEVENSVSSLVHESRERIKSKYGLEEEDCSVNLLLCRDGLATSHAGCSSIETQYTGLIHLTPLQDSELMKLKTYSEQCKDNNTLVALIMVRYCPELLAFPYNGGRKLDVNTLVYAKEISAKYESRVKKVSDCEYEYPDVKLMNEYKMSTDIDKLFLNEWIRQRCQESESDNSFIKTYKVIADESFDPTTRDAWSRYNYLYQLLLLEKMLDKPDSMIPSKDS